MGGKNTRVKLLEKDDCYVIEAAGPELKVTCRDGSILLEGIKRGCLPPGRLNGVLVSNGRRIMGRIPENRDSPVRATYRGGRLNLLFPKKAVFRN